MERVNHKDGVYLARLGTARREAIRQIAAIENVPMAVVVQRALDVEISLHAGRTMVLAVPAAQGEVQ